jgi:hypothetical protein
MKDMLFATPHMPLKTVPIINASGELIVLMMHPIIWTRVQCKLIRQNHHKYLTNQKAEHGSHLSRNFSSRDYSGLHCYVLNFYSFPETRQELHGFI